MFSLPIPSAEPRESQPRLNSEVISEVPQRDCQVGWQDIQREFVIFGRGWRSDASAPYVRVGDVRERDVSEAPLRSVTATGGEQNERKTLDLLPKLAGVVPESSGNALGEEEPNAVLRVLERCRRRFLGSEGGLIRDKVRIDKAFDVGRERHDG